MVEATSACEELHQLAVSLVTRDAERARAALPDVAGIDGLIDAPMLAGGDAGGFGVLGLARRLVEGSPTSADGAHMVAMLRSAVAAQERHHDRVGSYADTEQALVDEGLDPTVLDVEGDAWLWVWEGDTDAYCMSVSGARGSAHVESHDAEPVVETRRHPCPHTYPQKYAVPSEAATP